ncbi:MAG TPA: hypothetical protein VFT31_01440 [Kribbella sp.]|nr:hypothetical protein [Kribbella sp.]
MTGQKLTAERVHLWPRALAGMALVTSILSASYLTAVQGNGPAWWLAWWLPVLLVAYPLIFLHRKRFRFACLLSAGLTLVLAVVFFWLLAFVHLPAALTLVAAAAADPRWAPNRACVAVVVGELVAAEATTFVVWAWV